MISLLLLLLLLNLIIKSSTRYIIASDSGTESCRSAIFDITTGKAISSISIPYPKGTQYPKPGYAEQDPNDWWYCIGEGCRKIIKDSNINVNDIKCICVDTTACSVVVLDNNYNPIRPCLLWMDTRSASQCIEILEKGKNDEALLVNCNGKGPLSAEWMIPKALWIKQNEPNIWNNAKYVCEKQDYFNYKLSGEFVASGCNVGARWNWNAERCEKGEEGRPISLLSKLSLDDLLEKWPKRCVRMGEKVGVMTKEAKDHILGMEADNDIMVIQGGPDAYVGMIGLGVIKPGKLALITGSSHLHLAISSSKQHHDGVWGSYEGTLPGGLSFAEGGQTSTGSVLQWSRKLFDSSLSLTLKDLDDEAKDIPIGSEGLLALDTFQGSRTPTTNPFARGAIFGLTLAHKRGNVFRSFLESICYGTRACFDALKKAGMDAKEIYIAGGATRSELFLSMHADVCNLPVKVGNFDNSPLLGCAILAAVGSGYFEGPNQLEQAVDRFVTIVKEVQPNPVNVIKYNKFYELYRKAILLVKDLTLELVNSNNDESASDSSTGGSYHELPSKREAIIAPSILSADYGYIAEEAQLCKLANAKYLHIDMCDGGADCQRSLTVGVETIAAISKKCPDLKLDVHVVVNDSKYFIDKLAAAGAYRVIFQLEQIGSTEEAIEFASLVRDNNMRCAVCIKPETPVTALDPLLRAKYKDDSYLIEMVDVLAVGCGLSNQVFDLKVLEKVKYLHQNYKDLAHIAVDGGINEDTSKRSAEAGANLLIAGSYIFGKSRSVEEGYLCLSKKIDTLMNNLINHYPK